MKNNRDSEIEQNNSITVLKKIKTGYMSNWN